MRTLRNRSLSAVGASQVHDPIQFLAVLYSAAIVACGARTGLLVSTNDVEPPSSHDIEDAGSPEAPTDALPPIDVGLTPIPSDCPDASATLVYVIDSNGMLLSFNPPSATFAVIGAISCGSTSLPNSMAVDHAGLAYVAFVDGSLFQVSTRTAHCQPTPFVTMPETFASKFSMGFSANADGAERLYVVEDVATPRLATIDTTTFELRVVGPVLPAMRSPELTGTGAGALFGFSASTVGSVIGQIDTTTAHIGAQATLASVTPGGDYAFAFWGGDFYIFTAPAGVSSVVTRYRPSDGTIVQVASYPTPIVGAGVSTCAPQQ